LQNLQTAIHVTALPVSSTFLCIPRIDAAITHPLQLHSSGIRSTVQWVWLLL